MSGVCQKLREQMAGVDKQKPSRTNRTEQHYAAPITNLSNIHQDETAPSTTRSQFDARSVKHSKTYRRTANTLPPSMRAITARSPIIHAARCPCRCSSLLAACVPEISALQDALGHQSGSPADMPRTTHAAEANAGPLMPYSRADIVLRVHLRIVSF